MKKLNKLFAILFAVLGVQTLSAQTWTDVTSTYIKNPTLIASYYSTSDNTAWPVYTTGRSTTQHPKEWILHTKGTTGHNIGGAYFEAWAPSSTEVRWELFQDVTLPAGKYQLTGKYSTDQSRGLIRTVVVTPHHSYYSSGITSNNWGSWGAETAEFTIYEETQVRVGMISTNFAQCNGFTLTTSGAKQLLADEIAAAPEDLTEAIATAQNVYNNANSDDAAYRTAAKNLNDAVVAYNIENASESTPVDMTGRIANPSFEGVGGTTAYTGTSHNCTEWTYTSASDGGARSMTHSTYLNIDNTSDAFYCFNIWNDPAKTFTVSQTLSNMPAGHYRLSARYASDANNTATLYLNSTENGSVLTATNKGTFVDGSVTYTLAADGNLTIGITSDAWYKVDDFKLSYLGADLTLLEEAFEISYTNLSNLSTENVPTAFADKINGLLTTYETAPTTKKSLQTANAAIAAVVDLHPSIATAYTSLKEFIVLCTEYTDPQNSNADSEDILSTFNAAINTAAAAGNAATTVDAINAAYSTLETARRTYARNAVPVYPYPFDMTFMLPNTTFDSNTDGWTKTGGANWMSAGKNVECYNTTFEFSMEYTGLNSGSWEIQVDAFYRYGGYNNAEAAHNGGTEQLHAILYANNNTVAVKSIMEGADKAGSVGATTTNGVRVPDGPADCDAYFATGCYTNAIATVIADGKLKVGIKKETTQGSDWTIFDNFKLIYKGVDVTDLQNALSELIEKADAIKETKMGATESAALTDALTYADAENTNAEDLGTMISTLQSAYDAAIASIDLYATILPYITKAEGIDASIASNYRTQYNNGTIEDEAVTIFQNLEVATYNYVTYNFEYPVELEADGWVPEGPVGTEKGQHYDGTATSSYLEQSKAAWGSNAWDISYKYEKTLPEGKYIFKVAGRREAGTGTTMSLLVTDITDSENPVELGSVSDFPEGDTGLGINKKGKTSFADNDEAGFAFDGKGRGWQWRYVMFELDSDTKVQVAVNAAATTNHQWMSFCEATVQMTEETYLTANKGALDAPTVAAEALVDTKPMGTAENADLVNALAMPVTTGAELLAKIEALETAVAKAKAWVSAYNEAKAPLVAALDRFEADYNNAENGALDYMNKNRWATAISMAQAAAEAKDVTDSYDGFETATSKLVAALDAATVSVGEYADLKSAIENANNIINGGNIGDEPFQRPKSAVDALGSTEDEQAVYDAREAEGKDITSLTEALKNGCIIELNAPEEGDVFELAIQFAGWQLNDKPLTLADNGTGGISIFKNRDANYYAQTMMLKKVEGNKYTISSIAADGTERYVSTGKTSGVGDNTAQIRLTDEVAKALSVEVIPTATEGLYNLKNTEADALLGCQDDKAQGGLYTCNVRNNFTITKVDMPSVILKTPSYWATLILPFAAEIPDGLVVYSCTDAAGNELTLTPVDKIVANTPYLVCGQSTEFEHTFKGFGTATTTSYTEGLFTGTYVDYNTTADGKTYVLQKKDGEVAFYLVGESAQPTVKPNRIYMSYEAAAGAPVFRFNRVTTTIEDTELDAQDKVLIYDLMGRRVLNPTKGMYIVNGKKVLF